MDKICGMDLSRCDHEHMNSLVMEIWRNSPTAEHGYRLSSSVHVGWRSTELRAQRMMKMFTAWLFRCGTKIK